MLGEIPSIAVLADPPDNKELDRRARQVAAALSLPLAEQPAGACDLLMAVTPDRLELRTNGDRRSRPAYVDWLGLDTASSAGRSHRQPLVKAVAIKGASNRPQYVVDATAGFGQDAWLLASLGWRVTAIERSPVVAVLFQDGLRRAGIAKPTVAGRLHLIAGDARHFLGQTQPDPDVIYLDPMFPPKRKSALGRRPVRLLRQLVGDDPDAAELFDAAWQAARRRVVVKRPLHAPPLCAHPSVSYPGKSMRYDVYTKPGRDRV